MVQLPFSKAARDIYCEEGWYDTRNELSSTSKNARIDYGDQILQGDSLFYDRRQELVLPLEM